MPLIRELNTSPEPNPNALSSMLVAGKALVASEAATMAAPARAASAAAAASVGGRRGGSAGSEPGCVRTTPSNADEGIEVAEARS